MNTISQGYNERVRYTMYNELLGNLQLSIDPIGWNNDQKEYSRNEEYNGIITKFSNNLTFIEDGAEFINAVFDMEDINGQIKLTREEMHPITDKWHRGYWGYLDLSTRSIDNGQVKVKFNAGSIEQALKSRENETVEIDRLTTIDGVPIPELVTEKVALDGRRIFLKTQWQTKESSEDNFVGMSVFSDDGNTRSRTEGFPLEKLVLKSHEEAQAVLFNTEGNEGGGSNGMMILANFDRDRTLRVRGNNLHFRPRITRKDYQWAFFKVCLTIYKDGIDYNLKERRDLFSAHSDDGSMINLHNFERLIQTIEDPILINAGQSYTINFDETINVGPGESVAVEFFIKADLEDAISGGARFSVSIYDVEGTVFVEEDSHYEPSQSKFILAHELLDRLATICTNKSGVFKSDFFGRTDIGYSANGIGALTGVTHGFWVREFEESTLDEENRFKPLSTSWKDAVDSFSAVHNLSLGIETINNREIIRLEDSKYFYQPVVTIKIKNQVKKVKRNVLTKNYFSSIEVGYDRGGSYDEAQGLDEYNATSKFTTIINRVKETFTKISSYRADSYGMEFARRKPFSIYSTTDTSYDSDIFLLDLKRGFSSIFLQRKWQDDFEQEPTGTFSPDTATNLRFSPFNMLLRHGWWIASSLLKFPSEFVRYASSTANSKLKTKLNGSFEYAENGNILNSELERAHFINEEITFESECDFFTIQQIEGFTNINGKRVPNFYGMVEFTNEKNEIERGFILNLKPNGKGDWKLIKANF